MKLESLHIKNYKLFKDLEIPKLGQVNLITGKNNTGKTILLEALRIWASVGGLEMINRIIRERGDWNDKSLEKSYASIFPEKEINDKDLISINDLSIRVAFERNLKLIDKVITKFQDTEIVWESRFVLNFGDFDFKYPVFIPAYAGFNNDKLWEGIDLTDNKDKVIQILQIIEPSIIDLGIIDNVARVRTKNSKIPVPLKNFGEGLNRLLTIAMALVSAEDNLLLIDEVDTGLHYSVLEKLWEIIFEFSGQLKTQVFITTHSGDCVDAFTAIANKKEYEGMGNYFRLQWTRDHQKIVPIFYDENELEIAVDQNIETR